MKRQSSMLSHVFCVLFANAPFYVLYSRYWLIKSFNRHSCIHRSVVEWIERLLPERYSRVRFSVGSNQRLKIGIHSFLAWLSAIKGTVWSVRRVRYTGGSLTRRPQGFSTVRAKAMWWIKCNYNVKKIFNYVLIPQVALARRQRRVLSVFLKLPLTHQSTTCGAGFTLSLCRWTSSRETESLVLPDNPSLLFQ